MVYYFSANMLIEKVHIQWHIPSVAQVIFSTSCSYFIAPHGNLSQAHLVELLEKSGGSKGHAKLYLLPINQLKQAHVSPDTTFLTSLSEFWFHQYIPVKLWGYLCRIHCG